jgi:hypothetical protein
VPGGVTITVLGPPADAAAAALRERMKSAIQSDLMTDGAVAVLLTYSAATDSYRIETATEHLGISRGAGTARLQHRTADVRQIILACGAKVDTAR